MSTLTNSGANKKRKKSDAKQHQQQLNKCLNEKRRREQENIYIEELAELISASFADMSSLSVKPDKCAILQETVNQIRRIKQQEAPSGDAVQQGEVSSSKPALIGHKVFGPLLLEALEGFLFVVSSEGKVEFVTDNVGQFTRFSKDDVLGKSIYNFLHHGDHARFSSGLLPMAIGWPGEGSGHHRSRTFTCRLLIKPPDDQDETMEEKQQRVSKYETMQISSMLFHPGDRSGGGSGGSNSGPGGESESSESEGGPCMMCVARRLPANEKSGPTVEQFTTKIDVAGNIICLDTSGIPPGSCPGLGKNLQGKNLHHIVLSSDAGTLSSHLSEALTNGHATSKVYHLALNSSCPPLPVQTKTKLFKAPSTPSLSGNQQTSDFLMATHTIIHDLDANSITSPASVSSVVIKTDVSSPNSPATLPTAASLPSLPPSALDNSPPSRQAQAPPPAFPSFSSELALGVDFEFLTNSGGWELDPPATAASTVSGGSGSAWGSPPPPKPSPQQQSQQTPNWERSSPSPRNHPWDNNSQPSTPFNPMLDDPDTLPATSAIDVAAAAAASKDSARLRNLLTNTVRQQTSSTQGSRNQILKGLLNQEDDEEGDDENSGMHGMDNAPNAVASSSGSGNPRPSSNSSAAASSTSNNNMLLKLLNDTSDDGDLEARAGLKKQNELLQQLLKDPDESDRSGPSANSQEDSLLKSLGFGSSSPPLSQQNAECGSISGGRKRPSLESEDGGGGKRLHQALGHSSQQQHAGLSGPQTPSQVSSSGSSRLCEKNKMLASLLAKQPSQPATIPPIPASVLQATPNERLPKVVDTANPGVGRGNMGGRLHPPDGLRVHQGNMTASSTSHHHHHPHGVVHPHSHPPPKASPSTPTPVVAPQPPQGPSQPNVAMPLEGTAGPGSRLEAPADSSSVLSAVSSNSLMGGSANMTGGWDSTSSNTATSTNDEMLSDILDQVIDIVPDSMSTDSNSLSSFMDPMDGLGSVGGGGMSGAGGMMGGSGSLAGGSVSGGSSSAANGSLSERLAISAIQKNLMLCETAVKNPPQYPSQMQPPPPMYPSQVQQRAPLGFSGGQSSLQMATARAQYAAQHTQQQQLNNQTLMQRRKALINAQQQKQRLLQQQQQQVMVHTSGAMQQDALSPMDALLGSNNIVPPPNVSLQRSVSVPDSQLSPSYGPMSPSQQQQQQQQRQQQFQAFSAGFGGQQTTRLSPLPGSVVNQVGGSLPPFQQQQQLSPRVTQGFPQQTQQQAQWTSVSQAGTPTSAAAARLSLQQQQNPMLNAQLTAAYPTSSSSRMTSSYAQQQVQTRPSMRGGVAGGGARSSPFTPDNAPPTSPSPGGNSSPGLFSGGGSNMFGGGQQAGPGNFSPQLQMQLQLQQQQQQQQAQQQQQQAQQQQQQQQQMRLQRAMSQPSQASSNGPQHQQMAVAGHPNSWHHNSSFLLGYPPMVGSPAGTSAGLKHHHGHPHSHHPPPQSPLHPHHPAYHASQSPVPNQSDHMNSSYEHPSSSSYPPYSPLPHRTQLSPGANNGISSEFVRQELRATVCARTQQQQAGMQQQQQQQHGGMVPSPRQQSMAPVGPSGNIVTTAELEALGLSYEMPSTPGDGANRMWDPASSSQQQQMGPGPSSAREEAMRGSAASQSSLLQKLLSE